MASLVAVPLLGPAAWLVALLPVAGGFAAVYSYNRRTGRSVTMQGGARLGWLTGIFCFVILVVVLTFTFAMVASIGVEEVARQLARSNGEAQADQLRQAMASPAAIIFAVLSWFVMLTSLPTIGGALAARVFERKHGVGAGN
jgi:hypothetical protein